MKKSFNPLLIIVLVAFSFFSCQKEEMNNENTVKDFTEYLQLTHVSMEGCIITGLHSVKPSSEATYSITIDGEKTEGSWSVAEGNMLISSTSANEVTLNFQHDFEGGILNFTGRNADNDLRVVAVRIKKSAE